MLIRSLARDDAALLRECRLRGLQESPEAFLVSFAEVAPSPVSRFEAELVDPAIRYIGAFDGETLVGFMRYIRCERAVRRHVAEVRSVFVRSSARGQGIGKALLETLIGAARADGIESLILGVLEDNFGARRLYESCGFRHYGTEPRAIKRDAMYIGQALYARELAGG
jgi:GNAT superfamily N-acetyltransferase